MFGENGLIKKAEEAKNMAVNSTIEESEAMNKLAEDIENMIPFEPVPTPEPPTGGKEMTNMENGVIEIKWLNGTSNNVSDVPNAPVTKTINNGTMELVKYTGQGTTEQEKWVAGTEYSYIAGTGSSDNNESKWANARVTINGVDSYFVWIPRYAYRIIYFNSSSSKKAYQEGTLTEKDAVANGKIIGYSDSRGIVDASGKKIDSIASTTKTMVSKDYFMVHPAFINDVNAGGWTSELPGIWVGKYETSGESSRLQVVPGAGSLRDYIGTFYTAGLRYSEDLQSHMVKNSEWGAVAYLTESKYGRNGTKLTNNKYPYQVTGSGDESADYTSESGKKTSSTGNPYGVYDLSNLTQEYVSAYYNGSDSLSNGSSFASQGGSSTKYATAYSSTDLKSSYKYGDATLETKGWHLSYSSFISNKSPFLRRSGDTFQSPAYKGLFYYTPTDGYTGSYGAGTLRLVIVV